jgi:DNA-directed RNA polymerase omega subunit
MTSKLGSVVSADAGLNPFQLVLIGADRARQLMRGSRPMLETRANHPTSVVLEEFAAGLLQAEVKENGLARAWEDSPSQGDVE